jgi:hypothetical protein
MKRSIISIFLLSTFVFSNEVNIDKSKNVSDDDFFTIDNEKIDINPQAKKKVKVRKNSKKYDNMNAKKEINNPHFIENQKKMIEKSLRGEEEQDTLDIKVVEKINGDVIFKSTEELNIEKNFYLTKQKEEKKIKLKEIELERSINKQLKDLLIRKQTLRNDYKTYEIELQKIIRSRMQNRYADKTVQGAKLELYEAKQKYLLDMKEIDQNIKTLKNFPKKSKDYLLIYNNINSKNRLIEVSEKEFLNLKGDYYENKLIFRDRYYKELEKLKRMYLKDKNKLKIYYDLRTNTLINKIKGR